MAQTARPSSDISTTGWSATPSGALWSTLDESSVDDADYIEHTYSATSDVAEVKLASVSDPGDHTSHSVSYRCWVNSSGPFANDHNLRVSLIEGTTVIATETRELSTTPVNSPTTFTLNLSTGEAATITDYSDLRIRFEALLGDAGIGFLVSQAYLSVPDVVSSGGFTIDADNPVAFSRARDYPDNHWGGNSDEFQMVITRPDAASTSYFIYERPNSEADAKGGGLCALTGMWAPKRKLVYVPGKGRVIRDYLSKSHKPNDKVIDDAL